MARADRRELAPVAPELFVPNVAAAIRFYTEKLGFRLARAEREDHETTFAVVALGKAKVLLADEKLVRDAGRGGGGRPARACH